MRGKAPRPEKSAVNFKAAMVLTQNVRRQKKKKTCEFSLRLPRRRGTILEDIRPLPFEEFDKHGSKRRKVNSRSRILGRTRHICNQHSNQIAMWSIIF